MNRQEAQKIANQNNFGTIEFVIKPAINTGKLIEVGYVYLDGARELFCKRGSNTDFYLCNQFRDLAPLL